MITKIICASIGAAIMLVAIMVIACCKLSGDIARKAERWNDDE